MKKKSALQAPVIATSALVLLGLAQTAGATLVITPAGGDPAKGDWDPTTNTFTLTTDLAEDVRIDGDGITLDGGGHRIVGSGTGNGVHAADRTGVQVRGCTISGWRHGVFLLRCGAALVTENDISGTNFGVYLEATSDSTVSWNEVSGGFATGGYEARGITTRYTHDNTITRNEVTGTYYGIFTHTGERQVITWNRCHRNSEGIYAWGCTDSDILDNDANGNSSKGIRFANSRSSRVVRNEARGAIEGAFVHSGCTDNRFEDNDFSDCSFYGFRMTFGSRNLILRNDCNGAYYGYDLEYGGSNVIRGGSAVDCGQSALWIGNSAGNTIEGNEFSAAVRVVYAQFLSTSTFADNSLTATGTGMGLYMTRSTDCTLDGNEVTGGQNGIRLHSGCDRNSILDNRVTGHPVGFAVVLSLSDENVLRGNRLEGNYFGTVLSSSNANLVYDNRFDNTLNARVIGGTGNAWNVTPTTGSNILGGPSIGGNYWAQPGGGGFSQVNGDSDADGFCDTPLSQYTLAPGNVDAFPLTDVVADVTPPTLDPVPALGEIWPPNHRMVEVAIQANATDASGVVALGATITSSEPENGKFAPDYQLLSADASTGILRVNLRAERNGNGTDRVYTITVLAVDPSGNVGSATVTVTVPHDRRR